MIRLFSGDDFTYASSMAYYALVSLFPFLLLMASVVGRLTAAPAQRAAVADFVLQFFPTQVDLVSAQVESIARASIGFSLAGTGIAVWVLLGIVRTVSTAVNSAWNVEQEPSYLRHHLSAFAM